MVLIRGDDYLAIIDDIFTEKECQQLIQRANDEGWHEPGTGGSYDRAIIIDRVLAEKLYTKIEDMIPDVYDGYKLLYMNDHFRFSKYGKGGRFPIHEDGTNYDNSRASDYGYKLTESVFTLNIFLNDDFSGGETDFFVETSEQPFKLRYSAVPKTGRGALFYAKQMHCGNPVKSPYKYLIRTDVMGVKINNK